MITPNSWDLLTNYGILDFDANDYIYSQPSPNAFKQPVCAPLDEPLQKVRYPDFNRIPQKDTFTPEKKSKNPINYKKLISIACLATLATVGGVKLAKLFRH